MSVKRFIAVVAELTLVTAAAGCIGNSQSRPRPKGPAKEAQAERAERTDRLKETRAKQGADSTDRTTKKIQITSQLPDVVDGALPSVVGISTQRVVRARPRPFPFAPRRQRKRKKKGMGSGVIVDQKGHILTNHHVVKGADKIHVSFSDRRDKYQATIVGTDKATDIAVLKLKNPPEKLNPIAIGDSKEIRLGDPVVAIGNPFGLAGTVTYGIVSAKGRQNVGLAKYEDFIQTDAAINPGNSGGALVNMKGELIGINTAILSRTGGSQGIGFAVPSEMAQSVMQQLIKDGEVDRGHLGVMIQSLSPRLAKAFELPEDLTGVVVSKVQSDSPAAKAGLQRGDVITKFDGNAVESASDLQNEVAQTPPNTDVEVRIFRDGAKQTVSVKLGALNGGADGKKKFDRRGMLKGLVLGAVDQKVRRKLNLPKRLDHGIAVLDVTRGSPAARTGLRPGDVILQVNREKLESLEQLTTAYDRADERILLLVYRNGHAQFMAIPKVE